MKYQRGDEIPIKIGEQGQILVSHAYVERDCGNVLLVYLDLDSKWAELSMTDWEENRGPALYLLANEHTLGIDASKKAELPTIVEFPEQKGWRVFSVQGPGRYTLSITLMQDIMEIN